MRPPVDPIIFELGPLAVRWYGIIFVIGMIAATTVGSRWVVRKGYDGDAMWDLLVAILIPALIGARLYYVFIQTTPVNRAFFLENPGAILRIDQGGIHIYGAFVFGAIAAYVFARVRKLPFLPYLDAIGLGLPLGQAIGRWANFINQELYGPPTTLPWGLDIEMASRLPIHRDLPLETRFHPLFLYESLWNFLGFFLIFAISRRFEDWLKPGDLILLYLIWYPLGRFVIEFVRLDSSFFAGSNFNTVHVLSAIAVLASALTLYLRHRNDKQNV